MRMLAALGAQLFGNALTKWRRRAIALAVCGACLSFAIVELLLAATKALEPQVGALAANLILAAVLGLAALIAFLVVRMRGRTPANDPSALLSGAGGRLPPEITIAMLVEALMVGYSLARGPSKNQG